MRVIVDSLIIIMQIIASALHMWINFISLLHSRVKYVSNPSSFVKTYVSILHIVVFYIQ